jgi:hypothetical protein
VPLPVATETVFWVNFVGSKANEDGTAVARAEPVAVELALDEELLVVEQPTNDVAAIPAKPASSVRRGSSMGDLSRFS